MTDWWNFQSKVARVEAKFTRGGPLECWTWSVAVDRYGYGQCWLDGRNRKAHQVVFELAHKKAVPRGQFVLHSCDNPPCVNPAHLRLGDAAENAADRNRRSRQTRGEDHPQAKLTNAQVAEIRQALSSDNPPLQRDLAERYQVSDATIGHIKTGFTWKNLLTSE